MPDAGPLQPAADLGDLIRAQEHVREAAQAAQDALGPDALPMWVVMGPNTTDLPGAHLARLWRCLPMPVPTRFCMRAASLDEIRNLLPPGLTCLGRRPEDAPVILEVWM